MRLPRFLATLLLLALLTGCANTWSDTEKKHLTSFRLNNTTSAQGAYKEPDAKISLGMANTIPAVTGGGLIPALIGSAIDASVTAKQQRSFESTNARYFDQLKTTMAAVPSAAIDEALRRMFGADSFFGPRLADSAPCTFSTEILYYGLANSPFSQKNDIQLRLRIGTKVTLKLADGSVLFSAAIEGVASSAKRAAEIVADPEFYSKSTQEAATSLADQLQVMLEQKWRDSSKKS